MSSVPNELKININTSIPGFQKIIYNPNMTDKNLGKGENSVLFNPLIKLTQRLIDSVPENIRIKEFFIPGLFYSLEYYHGVQKAINLAQAKANGYIDNNIQITLNTLFPPNSVIYINGQPYVIVDVQWTKGDWKVDTKKKPVEFDTSRVTNPFLYASLVKEEIVSGEKQLEALPKELTYGPNYVGPPNVKSSVLLKGPFATTTPASSTTNKTVTGITGAPPPTTTPTKIVSPPQRPALPPSEKPALPPPPQRPALPPSEKPALPPPPQRPALMPPPTPERPALPSTETPSVQPVSTLEPSPEQTFTTNNRSTDFLRKYFKKTDYYNMTNFIYQNASNQAKEMIRNVLLKSTTVNITNTSTSLSRPAYDNTVEGLSARLNKGKGDCYFIAVAEAINYYNYKHQDSRIIHKNYGIGNLIFTPAYLRTLVYEYIYTEYIKPNNMDALTAIGTQNANMLNDLFEQQIHLLEQEGETITPDIYMENINNIYIHHDNFMVFLPLSVPIQMDTYMRPFRLIRKSEIQDYIESSNYWANELATHAMASILNLNVITIEKTPDNLVRCSYGMFTTNVLDNWNKYLFLYYNANEGHYELMTFKNERYATTVSKNKTQKNRKKQQEIISIFERNNVNVIPPLYILLLIYISSYINAPNENEFSFFPQIFHVMNESFDSIMRKARQGDDESISQIELYYRYFPTSASLQEFVGTLGNNSSLTRVIGGAYPASAKAYPLANTYPYPNAYPASNVYPYPNTYPAPNVYPYPNTYPYPNAYPRSTAYPYPNAYPSNYPYYRGPPRPSPSFQTPFLPSRQVKPVDNTNIAYYITIDMELHPGTSLSPEELKHTKCIQRKNAIRKSFSNLTGRPYMIPPVYKFSPYNKNKTVTNKNTNVRTNNNSTRRI